MDKQQSNINSMGSSNIQNILAQIQLKTQNSSNGTFTQQINQSTSLKPPNQKSNFQMPNILNGVPQQLLNTGLSQSGIANRFGNSIQSSNAPSVSSQRTKASKNILPSNRTIQPSNPNRFKKLPKGIERPELPKIQNVVSTVNMCCVLDLKKIALKARNAEYNPKRFAAVIIRIRDPKTTALIFGSGKMVCTGAKNEQASKQAARKYARIIQKLGFNVKFKEFKVQNIVASCDVKFPIKLEEIQRKHSKFCTYEPELFPGLIYKAIKTDPVTGKTKQVVLLIFVSGKLVLTGAKKREDIYQVFEEMYYVLLDCRKQPQQQVTQH